MESNSNQRKNGGRYGKNSNTNECMSPASENEVTGVSAVAISPTLEETESSTSAPAAECRRSSRKKIIKFDVRDLLNKNRKTHKIQIEARIDSNAPITSKITAAGVTEAAHTATVREDMLSKQKTFLEKSAIFRRYSISQEHKPPPLPLPIPPLLGKGNENKESGHSTTSSTRRLSRTQEFFSNAMIKPKQTTSLIIAQFESNTPSAASIKRKGNNRSTEIEAKTVSNLQAKTIPVVQQKKRGRPAKIKMQSSSEISIPTLTKANMASKKITPEKAKNWKEYKACLAQQSNQTKEEFGESSTSSSHIIKSKETTSEQKLPAETIESKNNFNELFRTEKAENLTIKSEDKILETSISKSEDYQVQFRYSEKYEESQTENFECLDEPKICDLDKGRTENSECLDKPKTSLEMEAESEYFSDLLINSKLLNNEDNQQNSTTPSQLAIEIFIKEETKMTGPENISVIASTLSGESNVNTETDKCSDGLLEKKIVLENLSHNENETSQFEFDNKSLNENVSNSTESMRILRKAEVSEIIKIENTSQSETDGEEKLQEIGEIANIAFECATEGIKVKVADDTKIDCYKDENEKFPYTTKDNIKQHLPDICIDHKKSNLELINSEKKEKDIQTPTIIEEESEGKQHVETLEVSMSLDHNSSVKTTLLPKMELKEEYEEQSNEEPLETTISLKDYNISVKIDYPIETESNHFVKQPLENDEKNFQTPVTLITNKESKANLKLITNDVSLLTTETSTYLPLTTSQETIKTFSRASSSSESENASERSSYSSAPSSSSSSSSSRSYKSGNNLRVSIKRISMPKSLSTSSQTSTSEKLSMNVLKKKPPTTKRSKRLQKKFGEILNDLPAADECFQRIENDETNLTICKSPVNVENVLTASLDNKTQIKSKELVKDSSTEDIKQEIEIISDTNKLANSIESTKTLTVTENIIKDTSTIVTRKSLRNRKDNNSDNDSESYNKKQKPQDQSTVNVQEFETEKINPENLEKFEEENPERTILDKKQNETVENITVDESDQYNESKVDRQKTRHRKTHIETPTDIKQQPNRELNKQTLVVKRQCYQSVEEKNVTPQILEDSLKEASIKNIESMVLKSSENDADQTKICSNVRDKSIMNVKERKYSEVISDRNERLAGVTNNKETSENKQKKSSEISDNIQDNKLVKLVEKSIKELEVNTTEELQDISLHKQINSFKSSENLNVPTENREKQTTEPTSTNVIQENEISSANRKSSRYKKDSICNEEFSSLVSVIDSQKYIPTITEQNSAKSLEDTKLQQNENVKLLPKRKRRKSRFKNLHRLEVESETDCNTENQTAINENILMKTDTQVQIIGENVDEQAILEETDKLSSRTEKLKSDVIMNKNGEEINLFNKLEKGSVECDILPGKEASSNLLSSQIQNVSIETNTLLDILRTVQSNTEAALKASKSTTNTLESDKVSPNDTTTNVECIIGANPKNYTLELDRSQQDKHLKSLKKTYSQSNTNSPTRSHTGSPLTLKEIHISSPRSETASPLILKNTKQSPTRSNSSSPLTFKKVTRRYERRSRRGDDTTHKTLEETFAEIAALSSKAVLAAKGIDIVEPTDETLQGDKTQLNVEEAQIIENIELDETLLNITEATSEPEEKVPDADENVQDSEIALTNFKDCTHDQQTTTTDLDADATDTKSSENILEIHEISEIDPEKRGRKVKSHALEVSGTDLELKIESKAKNKTLKEADRKSIIGTEDDEKVIMNARGKDSPIEDLKDSKSATKTGQTELCEKYIDKSSNEVFELSGKQEGSLKTLETTNENKTCKKSTKKRDIHKELSDTAAESTSILAGTCTDNEDNIRSPKQSIKKRDSSQPKIETKPTGKKLPKKSKNNEEDTSTSQKKDNVSIPTTTQQTFKRGRKSKNLREATSSSTNTKKKNRKDISNDNKEEDVDGEKEKKKILGSESESKNVSFEKTLNEKMAKKKRQKKLKEAFEAALTDDVEKTKETLKSESTSVTSQFSLTILNKSPPPERRQSITKDFLFESTKITCVTPVEPEEDPDPLKDIEKFIADGVNLLKKDYKLDEDSVDNVIASTKEKASDTLEGLTNTTEDEIKPIIAFETPADTPINTPSATPPPKSPILIESSTTDETSGVRRSHRIKLITKAPKALVGRGLVRDKERFSIKDDVETKSHYTMDDHLTGLAEVEAKNARFLKEMEERLSNFQVIKENEYLCERVISREAKKMICDCFLTQEEEERGELGCGEDCLNRLLMIECGPDCNVKERCTNKRFQKLLCSPCCVFRTEKKGFGIMADIEILPGEFIMEYVGEVIDTDEFEKRRIMYSQDKNRHYYFMALRSDAIIDATIKGNISRFINHSCDPNAETQKWTVNGELRIGFFSRKSIMPGEEITFNYQYQRYGREAQRCYCESANCRGWIGQEPTSDEGEQIDDDDEEDESDEDEEEADTSNLLVQDDDEDSDTSVTDPEEVQKQLEMAAAQAEVELAPLQLLEEKHKKEELTPVEGKATIDSNKAENEEDSKSKFKKLLSKMAEKVAAKQKQNKREQKLQRKKKSKESSADLTNKLKFLEDPDIEDEVEFLKECGLKNQSDTLRLSRLMVRAKLVQTRLNLLEVLRKGDLPCRRLFLDYHGLRLLHGWMSEDAGNMQIRLSLLQTLETLPIANKTVLTDSKVMQVVRNWYGNNTGLSPNEDSSSSNSNSQDVPAQVSTNLEESSDLAELQKLALKLITTWEGLPEIFRIPKKERIEQMKEHEREADRQYAANSETSESTAATDRYRRDRFGRGFHTFNSSSNSSNRFVKPNNGNPLRTTITAPENIKNLSKAQRREMFAAKVARDEAEKRLAEERREFETKCRFFGLDPKKTRPLEIPFCVNPATGQWFSIERKPITTPPSYAHVQVPVKPKSTDPNDYQLPAACSTLPPQWKYAITPQGKIYYYHIKHRVSQWNPPTVAQLHLCENEDEEDSENELASTIGEDSSDDDDNILIGMDAIQLKDYIDRKVEARRQKRYQRLVDERSISPRREEDRIYNQIEVRKYKENKEKIRKRKEEIRRRRAEALRQLSLNICSLSSLTEANPNTVKSQTGSDEELGALPIQDYLLSSDEEVDIKAEINSPLIDRIVEGDKIVDELDALTTKRQLKRPLPPHRDLSEPSTSSAPGLNPIIARQEYKKRKLEKKEKRKTKEQDAKYRKNKEKFRCEIAGIIVHHLKPYRKDTCTLARIQSDEDFNHLARKLTHFVMIKELKYCESVGQTLVVTESVKSKSREFIKKYMAKYGDVYVKPTNDPEFKDIPFIL